MASSYERAVSTLFSAPHESFVSERRRLAGELKAEGDKAGAAQLSKLGRPPLSAWAVNQLWWHAREAFGELFETAAQLRKGKLSASPAHRKAIAKLGVRAQQLLNEGGHSVNDATLRRITMTLSGLAATGGFEPEPPGALSKDRDPPGFEAFGIESSSGEQVEGAPAADEKTKHPAADAKRASEAAAEERKREAQAVERRREAQAAERKREAEAQAKRLAQRKKLESELSDAQVKLAEREHERDRITKELAAAEREVERARAGVEAAQSALDTENP